MRWVSVEEELPKDLEEVIVKVKGHFYLAQYHDKLNVFKTKSGIELNLNRVIWARLETNTIGDNR